MQKRLRIYLILFFLATLPELAHAFEQCPFLGSAFTDEVQYLTNEMLAVTGELSTKVLSIKVNHDGSGSVAVLTDNNGNLIGLRLDYKNAAGALIQETKTVEQFNKGESVSFKVEGQIESPLVLKTRPGSTLTKTTGGDFSFILLTATNPKKYLPYDLSLVKVGDSWKVKKAEKVISATTISPKISWSLSWEGTFKSATFE